MSRDHIPGFPHKMPQVNWDDNLPVFQGEKFDDPLLHLIKFHIRVWRLKVEWHEDCLMKIFMLTLEGKARDCYECLRSSSLFSLRDLEYVFYENYKENTTSLSLGAIYYDPSQNITQHIVDNEEALKEMHHEDLLTSIHEFNLLLKIFKNIDESVEEEMIQEIMDVPQDIPENSNIDSSSLIVEAQEDIQPQNQSSQETENGSTLVQRNIEKYSPLIEKEIDQNINKQPLSETFCKTNTLAHSHRELCCTDLESSFVDPNEEGTADNPVCLIGSITYIHDSPNFDLSSDDASQT